MPLAELCGFTRSGFPPVYSRMLRKYLDICLAFKGVRGETVAPIGGLRP